MLEMNAVKCTELVYHLSFKSLEFLTESALSQKKAPQLGTACIVWPITTTLKSLYKYKYGGYLPGANHMQRQHSLSYPKEKCV